jgi:hypothetical protein
MLDIDWACNINRALLAVALEDPSNLYGKGGFDEGNG